MRGKSKDTVPAMLSPGEAVLTARAADLIGRKKIAEANAMGKRVRHYAGGTPSVPGNAPSPHRFGGSDSAAPGDYVKSYAARGNVQPQDLDLTTPVQKFHGGVTRVKTNARVDRAADKVLGKGKGK